MKYDFIIFGGTGLQGRICARDLLESGYSVLVVGRDQSKIKHLLKSKKVSFHSVDLRNQNEIIKTIKDSGAEVVVNCAELIFNIPIMKACLITRKSLVDLGGLQNITKKQFQLDSKFKKEKILCLTGCGSTPGILNIMVKHAVDKMDSVDSIKMGFAWDSNIKKFVIPYSIPSIFHEFTEDPVAYHNGKFIKEKRASCLGQMNFLEVGKQKVYCIVHSEVFTFSRYFKNKNVKEIHYMAGFPEHSMRVIQDLISTGFNEEKEIKIKEVPIKIVDFTNKILKNIVAPKGYTEVENIWAEIVGKMNGKNSKIDMNCIVKTLKGWEKEGSNIDTGRTISIVAQMLKNNQITEKGVHAPEGVVPQDLFFKELSKRQMFVYENGKKIN